MQIGMEKRHIKHEELQTRRVNHMSFEEVADGFVFFCLRIHPELPLEKAYEKFCKLLISRGYDPYYENFLLLYLPAEEARKAGKIEQDSLLNALHLNVFFLNLLDDPG